MKNMKQLILTILRRGWHLVSRPTRIIAKIIVKYNPDKCPDKWYLKLQWENSHDYKLNLKNPKTLSEKIVWLKLYDRKPLYTELVDKYKAKFWLSSNFGNEHIIPTIKQYKRVDDINWEELPNEFVIKCNHDSGSVYICRDKTKGVLYDKHMKSLSIHEVEIQLREALTKNYYLPCREWPYKNVVPCIIVEKLMLQKSGELPNDYKLFFINGEIQFVYLFYARESIDDRCTYDGNWNRLPFVYVEKQTYRDGINTAVAECPQSFQEMIKFGKEIAKNFKFVRIDLYDIDGKMYFGEITPFHSAGCAEFFPEKYDLIFGEKLKLS